MNREKARRVPEEGADGSIRSHWLLVDAEHGRDLPFPVHAPALLKLTHREDVYRISDEDRKTVLPDNLGISHFVNLSVSVGKADPI